MTMKPFHTAWWACWFKPGGFSQVEHISHPLLINQANNNTACNMEWLTVIYVIVVSHLRKKTNKHAYKHTCPHTGTCTWHSKNTLLFVLKVKNVSLSQCVLTEMSAFHAKRIWLFQCFRLSNSACLVMEVKCILNTAWPEYKLSLCSSLAMMLFLPSLTYNQRLSRPHGPESGSGWVGWGRVRGGDVRLGGTTRYVCVCVYKYSGCKKVSGLICSTDYAVLVAAWQCDCSGLCCFVFFRLNRILIDRVVL